MILHIIFETETEGPVDFLLGTFDFEKQMEVLDKFVSDGHPIRVAYFVDVEAGRIELPLLAFDGEPIGCHMLELQAEYQWILRTGLH